MQNQSNQSSSTLKKVDNFYESCLGEQWSSLKICERKICTERKTELLKEQSELREKLEKCEEVLTSCLSCIAVKEKTIDDLTKKIKDQVVKNRNQPKADLTNAYVEFSEQFNGPQLSELRSISLDPCNDSTFILKAVRNLYADNIEHLKRKSVTGKAKSGSKEPISPEKLSTLDQLYRERLNNISKADERDGRIKKFNTHVKNALRRATADPHTSTPKIELLISNTENDIVILGKLFENNLTIAKLKVYSNIYGSKTFT